MTSIILKKAFAYFFLFLDTAATAASTITEPAIVDSITIPSPVCGEDVTLEVEPFFVVFLVVVVLLVVVVVVDVVVSDIVGLDHMHRLSP